MARFVPRWQLWRRATMTVYCLLCTCMMLHLPANATGAEPVASNQANVPSSVDGPPLNAAQQIAPVIQSSIRSNSEQLQGVELTVTRTFEDRSETEATVEKLPDGGSATVTPPAKASIVERVVVLEDRLRVDHGGNGTSPVTTYWFDGVRWTESNSAARRVAKRHPHQMGGRTLDPREAVGIDHRTSLAQVLARPALKDATLSTRDSVTSITTTAPGDQKLVVEFDSKYGMLPTRSQLFHENGAVARDVRIDYAWIADRKAWALAAIVDLVFAENVDGLATPDQWMQRITTSVTCNLLEPEAAQKLLSPVIPAGYQVIDFTDAASRPRKAPQLAAAAEAGFPVKWFVLAHVVLFAIVAAVIVWRRRRTSPV